MSHQRVLCVQSNEVSDENRTILEDLPKPDTSEVTEDTCRSATPDDILAGERDGRETGQEKSIKARNFHMTYVTRKAESWWVLQRHGK